MIHLPSFGSPESMIHRASFRLLHCDLKTIPAGSSAGSQLEVDLCVSWFAASQLDIYSYASWSAASQLDTNSYASWSAARQLEAYSYAN